ncbi:hypothetical protein SGRIM128S_06185 [Streptomyces griseomycini]
MEGAGPAVQVPEDGGPGHRLVPVGEDRADRSGLVEVGDLPRFVQVGGEAEVLGRLLARSVVTVHAGWSPPAAGTASRAATTRAGRDVPACPTG